MSFPAVQKHPRYRLNAAVDLVTAAASIETAAAENISLGGIFIRTSTPPPMASPVRLRLRPTIDSAIGLFGSVVHVVDAETAAIRALPMGAGIQFQGLPPQTVLLLRRFVDGLALQATLEAELSAPARFIATTMVEVKTPRAVLQALWTQGLQHGGLFAAGEAPPLGTMVRVFIGPLELLGEVVHIGKGEGGVAGAGLHLKDLEGPKLEGLLRFLDGTVDALHTREARPNSAPLAKVLGAARRLFVGIDDNDPCGGIGLPETATVDDVSERVALLRRVFASAPADASPPQVARIASALKTLDSLEPVVLARVAALRHTAELATRLPSRVFARGTAVDPDTVTALLAEAGDLERRSHHSQAKKVLVRALELAPDDETVQRRLAAVDRAIDLARAIDLLDKAEVIIHVEMQDQAVENALEATRLSSAREIHLRAIRLLARASKLSLATSLAEEFVQSDPRDHHALQALMILHEKAEHWADALSVGEALLRLKPADSELQKRVKKLASNARHR
jgi:hypothetical protein